MLVFVCGLFFVVILVTGMQRHNVAWVLLPVLVCIALLASALFLEFGLDPRGAGDLGEGWTWTRETLFADFAVSLHLVLVFGYLGILFLACWSKLAANSHKLESQTQVAKSAIATTNTASNTTNQNTPHPVLVSGISAFLPGSNTNPQTTTTTTLEPLFQSTTLIQPLKPSVLNTMVSQHVVHLERRAATATEPAATITTHITNPEDSIQVAGQTDFASSLDMREFGVSDVLSATMDPCTKLAVAAGVQALKDAGLISATDKNDPRSFVLPAELQDSTGVIYASSFPSLESAVAEVTRRYEGLGHVSREGLVAELCNRLQKSGASSPEIEAMRAQLLAQPGVDTDSYEFDRKFLFRILVLANAQLAQTVHARGFNTHINAACAGTSQAISLATDLLRLGRVQRMIVIAADDASSDVLMPWVGSGFRALGAATIAKSPQLAAQPFSNTRSGMIVGSGAVGLVLAREDAICVPQAISSRPSAEGRQYCRVVDSEACNSAYHGAAMDAVHISSALERLIARVESTHGISRGEIAAHCVYIAHETMTKPCAPCELSALKSCFGPDNIGKMVVTNTKGMTGHAMGVSFEDVVAAEILRSQRIPCLVNSASDLDPKFANDGFRFASKDALTAVNVQGGKIRYVLRFAAGFGSHVVFVLFGL